VPAADPDVLVTEAKVRTVDPTVADADAILVRDGRVAAVGPPGDLRAQIDGAVRVVPVDGATVIPGLIDTHPHLMHYAALHAHLVDLTDALDHADIAARIVARAAQSDPGDWIITTPVGEPHYFLRRSWRDLAEGVLPDRHVLDAAASDHPVLIQAWAPVTPNVAVMSSRALELVGVDSSTPDVVGKVTVQKDDTGEPTGRFIGSVNNYYNDEPFWDGLLRQVPLRLPHLAAEATRRAMSTYNALGVTAVYEGHVMGRSEIGLYGWLAERDELTLRVTCCPEAEAYSMPWLTAGLGDEQFDASLRSALEQVTTGDDWYRVEGVTVGRGGPCWPGMLRMRDPYRGPYGEPTSGTSFVSRERARRAIEFCAANALRLNVMAIGLADHDDFLQDMEEVEERTGGVAGASWLLQHGYLMEEDQARRYAALGFDMTASMSFSWGKGDMLADRIGEHVLQHLVPLRRCLDAGLTVAASTDWGPKNPFEQLQLSLTHELASGRSNLGPAQRITRSEALELWTRSGARVLGRADIGTLTPGAHADLAVLDLDPLTTPAEDLAATRVLATMVGGAVVHDTGLFDGL